MLEVNVEGPSTSLLAVLAWASSARMLSALLGGLSTAFSYATLLRLWGGSCASSLPLVLGADVAEIASAPGLAARLGRNSCEKMQLVSEHCSPYGQAMSLKSVVVENTMVIDGDCSSVAEHEGLQAE